MQGRQKRQKLRQEENLCESTPSVRVTRHLLSCTDARSLTWAVV